MRLLGEAALARFARKHSAARKPLQRFAEIVRAAAWKHIPDVKATFGSTDLAVKTRKLVFDLGGNKYRVIATIDFDEQLMLIEQVLTHEEYSREVL